PLAALREREWSAVVQWGAAAELRLSRFARTPLPARVRAVLEWLERLAPASLLDVGSGRGTFLWPLLEARPALPVTAIDADPLRAQDLAAVRRGGVTTLAAYRMDAGALAFPARQFDAVTVLEVLEHIPDWEAACAECVRVAARALLLSVPARPDNNPDHRHLLTEDRLTACLRRLGARRVEAVRVPDHLLLMARLAE
ncbi:MAG TPA: class I SAM-dependent methyltransferase, partial [Armatimonadota bacterium]|nr:class I SAM-dependent methyltransferase [Armatimonadota bacterium]